MLERLVDRGDVVLDVGARWGVYSWLLARRVGPEGHVHVFEPNPLHAGALRSIGRRRNVTIHELALSDADGDARLHVPVFAGEEQDGLASLAAPETEPEDVRTVPIRTARLDSLRLEEISFVKCDVEGHELAVLRGAEETLRASRPALLVEIEERHHGADPAATFAFAAELGYSGYAVCPDGLRPLEEFDLERDQRAFLAASGANEPIGWSMPSGYVHDFLFVEPRTDLGGLGASR